MYDEEREEFRERLGFILHRRSDAWHPIDPQGWVSQRRYNDQDFPVMKEKFFADLRQSLSWLEEQRNADWDLVYESEVGKISAGSMFAAWVAHGNLHVRQLVELRRKWIERITQPYRIDYAGDW